VRYLLDTATWANSVTLPAVLPERIRRLLDTDEIKGVCSVSLLELAIHHRRGTLAFAGSLDDFFKAALADDIELVELTPEIAVGTNGLPAGFQGDPFDRTIAATAKHLNLALVTADKNIRDAQCCLTEYYPFRPSRARP
jgi:PIN domain nuclease of toxin-antitoxin system